MNTKPVISVVIPVYHAESFLTELVLQLQHTADHLGFPFEIILVDDRSPDGSWELMKSISTLHQNVQSIRLSRNFGQHPAIMAGLSRANGDWVVVMDCDLQDKPSEIVKLFRKAQEGFDVVLARRVLRNDSFMKRLSSKIYGKAYGYFTDTHYDHEIGNFGIYHQKVISSIMHIGDYIKFFPLFVKFVGFETTSVVVEHAARQSGKSSYNLSKLVSLAFNSIISFSNKPLKLFVKFGMIISLLSVFVGLFYIIEAINDQIAVIGYTSIIVSIWFLSGALMTTIGIAGIYIGKIFDQTKSRPVFIIDEEL